MITSYAHICREYGVCVAWRTSELCRKGLNSVLKLIAKSPCFGTSQHCNVNIFERCVIGQKFQIEFIIEVVLQIS